MLLAQNRIDLEKTRENLCLAVNQSDEDNKTFFES